MVVSIPNTHSIDVSSEFNQSWIVTFDHAWCRSESLHRFRKQVWATSSKTRPVTRMRGSTSCHNCSALISWLFTSNLAVAYISVHVFNYTDSAGHNIANPISINNWVPFQNQTAWPPWIWVMEDMSSYLDIIGIKTHFPVYPQIEHTVIRIHFRLVQRGYIPDVRMS